MSLLDELHEEKIAQESLIEKKKIEIQLNNTRAYLKKFLIGKWSVVKVSFGDHLLKDESMRYRKENETFNVQEMKNVKGLNYGEFEFCYDHYAIILSSVHHKYIDKLNQIIVVPISTTKRKHSVLLEKRYNQFLEYDSHILLENIRQISIERINTKEKNLQKKITMSPTKISELEKELKSMFEI